MKPMLHIFIAILGCVTAMSAAQATPTLSREDIETFADGYMARALSDTGIPGAVVAVVKDGKVLFEKGYGFSDLEAGRPVRPDRTLFRIGSVTKPFVWTSVMQLVERGRIDLDRDINAYLDFKIPPRFGKPITMRHLMTHTPGFEDTTKNHYPADTRRMSLGGYARDHLPERIFAPGDTVAYSNYGAILASYIVQRVSGEPFELYIERYIFRPLGMAHSTLRQPLPSHLLPLLSRSYGRGATAPDRFVISYPAASGGGSSTASDMARFMIAHLQEGRFGEISLLKPDTVALMHRQHYRPAPGINGFTLGFGEEGRNGLRIIGHGGSTTTFYTDLMLLTERGIGLFVSVNGVGPKGSGRHVPAAFNRAFLDRYFPYQPLNEPTLPTARADASRVAGHYFMTRRTDSAFRFIQPLMQAEVTTASDGTIQISSLLAQDGAPKKWREVGPLLYREVGGQARVKFVTNKRGDILYWTTDEFPPVMLFQRMSKARSAGTILPLLSASLGVLALLVLGWAIGPLLRRHYYQPLKLDPPDRRLRLWSRVGALILLAAIMGWSLFGLWVVSVESRMNDDADLPMYLLYGLAALAMLGAAAVIIHAVAAWRYGSRPIWVRIGEIVAAGAACYSAWFMLSYGMLSFSIRY